MRTFALGSLVLFMVLPLAFAGVVAMQPATLEAESSMQMRAQLSDVEPYLRDLRLWNEWSPWTGIDPNLEQSYSKESTGGGAWYEWKGNEEVGRGVQTITSNQERRVVHELAFKEPFEDVARSTMDWTSAGEFVTVTWSFHQDAGFMTKAANLFMDIEGMVQGDYERGLANLKRVVDQAVHERQAREELVRQGEELVRVAKEDAE